MSKKNLTKAELIKENERLLRKISRLEKKLDDVKTVNIAGQTDEHFKTINEIFFENYPLPYYSLNKLGEITGVNKAWCRLFGYKPSETIGKSLAYFLDPREKPKFKKYLNKSLKEGEIHVLSRMVNKKGDVLDLSVDGKIVKDKNGKFIQTHCVMRDISERLKVQREIIKERDLARKYFDIAGGIMLVCDTKGKVILINKKGCEILGCTQNRIVGKNWISNFVPRKYRSSVRSVFTKISDGELKEVAENENPIITALNEERLITWHNTVIQDDAGNITGILSSGKDITESKRITKLLTQSEENYRRILENATDGITQISKYGKITEVNTAAANMFGGDKSELIGKHFTELKIYEKNMLPQLRRAFTHILTGSKQPITISIRNMRGEKIFVASSASLVKEGDKTKGVMIISRDITAQQIAESNLRNSRDRYEAIFHSSPLGIFHFDKQGFITECNEKFVAIIGSSKSVLIGMNLFNDLRDEKLIVSIKKALKDGSSSYEDNYESITADKVTPVRVLFSTTRSTENKVIGGIGIVEDITERKKADLVLRQSQTRFKELADSLPQMIFESDLKGNLTYANKNAFDIMGYSENDLKNGLNTFSILNSEFVDLAKRNFRKSLFKGLKGGVEFHAKKKDGSILPIEIYSSPIFQDEKLVGLRGIIIDLTERKMAEEELRKSEEKFSTIFNNAPDGIAYLDIQGNILETNPAITSITDLTRDELIGNNILNLARDLVSEMDYNKVYRAISQIASGNPVESFEVNYKKIVLEITIPSKSTMGGVTAIFRDVTERRRVEQQLLLNAKRQELVLESLPLMFYTGDPNNDLLTTWISHQVEDITGFTAKQFTGDKAFWKKRLHPEHSERVLKEYSNVLEKGYIKTEYKWLCADGTYQWFVDRVILVRDANNIPKETIGVWLNISDSKKVQQEVIERNKFNRIRAEFWELASRRNIVLDELLDKLLEKVGMALNISRASYLKLNDSGEEFVKRNQWYSASTGSSVQTAIPVKYAKHYYGRNFVDIPKDLKTVSKAFAVPLLKMYKVKSYLIVVCGDVDNPTSLFTISDCSQKREWTNLEKDLLAELARIFDTVSRQFKYEEAIRQSEEKYRDIVTWAPIGIYQSSVDGKFISVNASLAKILGYEGIKDIMGYTLAEDIYYSKGERNKLINEYDRTGLGSVKNLEVVWKKKDGSPIWVLLTSHAIRNLRGETIRYEGFVVDISDSKRTQAALKESEETLRSFINAIPETALLIDTDMKLLAINSEMMSFLKMENRQVIGRNIKDIFPDRIDNYRMEQITNVINSGNPIQFEDERDGRYYQNFINPVLDSEGKTSRVSIFAFDLTERKLIEQTIMQAKEEAEKSSRLKSEFLAQMSHEIRTPINTILSFTSLIESNLHGQLDSELTDGFGIIHSASKRVTRTIDLILNMSEIQTGTYEYNPKEFDLFSEVLQKLGTEFARVASNKGLNLIISKSTDITKIVADEYSITQIFANLIDNAIKYTKSGSIGVKLGINSVGKLEVKVSDTGIGISKKYLPQLFEPFSQETQGYTRSFEGNGLGLALVKKYCEYNDADISVDSVKRKGTIFTVTFNTIRS